MILNTIETKNIIFKEKFETILLPLLNDKLVTDDKAEFSLYEINELINEDYVAPFLYQKLKNILSYSELQVSIKKDPRNSKFIFFKKTDKVSRESDLFKVRIEKVIKSQHFNDLLDKDKLGIKISASGFKKFFKCNEYTTNAIYAKLKNLFEKTEIDVSISRNILIEGEYDDIFKFYYKKNTNLVRAEEKKVEYERIKYIKENEDLEEERKEVIQYFKESDKNDREEDLKLREDIVNKGAKLMKDYIIPDIEVCKCPACENGILKFPELVCPICKTKVLEKWE